MLIAEIIPSHKVAQWLLVHIHRLLDIVGLEKDKMTEEIIYVAIIVVTAMLLGWLLSYAIRLLIRKIVDVRSPQLATDLKEKHVLIRCCRIVPPLVILALLPFAFTGDSLLNTIIIRALLVYTSVTVCMAICSVLSFAWLRFDKERNTKNLPIRGILDTVIGILWVITAIICVAIIVDKSPAVLLTGLGAFAAVLMLVFKDSILGLVAGLQLSQNDMLRVGDWIVVPSTIANGIVIDVSLTAVKVQNWDNTIVTLPPYTLISGSFQNWRGMSDSGYRLICRSILVDADTVREPDADMMAEISKLPGMADFIATTQKNGIKYDPGVACVNGTASTNLGLLRAYLCIYLLHHPLIGTTQQLLVNLLQPTENGIPLQIYCYTTTAWTAYEAVQSEIFEHVAAVAPKFGLQIFNAPSGIDLTNALEAQKR